VNARGFQVTLEEIDECFQGAVPSIISSCAADGTPNVTQISIVHRLDTSRIAVSRQFFNKTIANMMANPRAQIGVMEPSSGRMYRISVVFEHTENEGPLFDRIKTQLDAVASYEGMASVFKLAAVDVCRVVGTEKVASDWDTVAPARAQATFDQLDVFCWRLSQQDDVEALFTEALNACAEVFACQHSFLMLLDEAGQSLYTVASHGYETSGVGADIALGEGLVGIAGQRRQSIRIGNMLSDLAYVQAVRDQAQRSGADETAAKTIPLPGLPNALSQLAVPIIARERLLGVLCLQSEVAGRFTARDEAALNVAARQIGLSMMLLRYNHDRDPMIVAEIKPEAAPVAEPTPSAQAPAAPSQAATQGGAVSTQVRYYPADDSVFVDGEYVIKGVAGRVLWRLLRSYSDEQRVEFTNKEIRLDPYLELPDIKDNLEARLILLRARMEERCPQMRIANTGRGRFRLDVMRPFELREVTA
jgi:adenylate cyclase